MQRHHQRGRTRHAGRRQCCEAFGGGADDAEGALAAACSAGLRSMGSPDSNIAE